MVRKTRICIRLWKTVQMMNNWSKLGVVYILHSAKYSVITCYISFIPLISCRALSPRPPFEQMASPSTRVPTTPHSQQYSAPNKVTLSISPAVSHVTSSAAQISEIFVVPPQTSRRVSHSTPAVSLQATSCVDGHHLDVKETTPSVE